MYITLILAYELFICGISWILAPGRIIAAASKGFKSYWLKLSNLMRDVIMQKYSNMLPWFKTPKAPRGAAGRGKMLCMEFLIAVAIRLIYLLEKVLRAAQATC